MGRDENTVSDENLQFFGKIVASISHEIKNVMAIINEKAGLLKDLSIMVEKGVALNPARIAGLADDLKHQIKRGDEIIKSMNRFAHSVDELVDQVDISDLTGLMTRLCVRSASQRGAALDFEPCDPSLTVRTRPYLLQLMIWNCLQTALDSCGDRKSVKIRVESGADACRIRFSLQDKGIEACGPFPTDSAAALAENLCANIDIDDHAGEIVLNIPVNPDLNA